MGMMPQSASAAPKAAMNLRPRRAPSDRGAKHDREGVVGGNTVLEGQDLRKEWGLSPSELDNLDARLAPT
jgi:hypothetical protein